MSDGVPVWLDAPTCEGWWWYKQDERKIEVVRVEQWGESLAESNVWSNATEIDCLISEMPGRWFGPLAPPEW